MHKPFFKIVTSPLVLGTLLTVPVAAQEPAPPTILTPPPAALCVPLTSPTETPPSLWHFTRQPCDAVPQQTLAEVPPGDHGVVVRVLPDAEEACWRAEPVHPGVVGWLQMLWGRVVPQTPVGQ